MIIKKPKMQQLDYCHGACLICSDNTCKYNPEYSAIAEIRG